MPATSTERRPELVRRGLLAGAAAWALSAAAPAAPAVGIQVWKDPSCGCCKDWIQHLEAHGFRVSVSDSGNIGARRRLGIAEKYGSCHTARVGGYAIEGHVPAREILRLLKERPQALGLAVPGMPVGSPGMDGPVYGDRKDPYDVLLLSKDGSASVYQTYR
ncbi:DUF411 domain-containing protein [Roseateles sp.]|uniref:DUF411 domain-containing protein n=1 Tax=Roseateles sp. TaxID=1971397 RepID=UPI0039E85105